MEIQNQEKILVIDFGGQYNQLVARRVRENNVYCEIYSYRTPLEKIREMQPKGIILTGGPASCYEEGAASCDPELFRMGVPVLGLCYGAQLMQWVLGGKVERAANREYGRTEIQLDTADSPLLKGVPSRTVVWMSHFDFISRMAPGFTVAAHSLNCPVAVCEDRASKLYGIQFHRGCSGSWRMDAFVAQTVEQIREKVGDGRVLLGLSGGVDSSVAAVLLSKAIGEQLTCVFVDHGLLRKNEADEVDAVFGPSGPYRLNYVHVDAKQHFYDKLWWRAVSAARVRSSNPITT